MLNTDSLFLSPLTFFGSYQIVGEEMEDDEFDLIDPTTVFFEANIPEHRKQQIGLFLYWFDVNE